MPKIGFVYYTGNKEIKVMKNTNNNLDGVSGREFEKREIVEWFKFASICHILVKDNGNEYQMKLYDLDSALEFMDNLPETAEVML
jgi:hypothetical protein